jgi:hypothetical protein
MAVRHLFAVVFALTVAPVGRAEPTSPPPVKLVPAADFNRDVLPILSDHCFACHGPDAKARKAKLRLDTPEGIANVVVAGKPADSDLIDRVASTDPDHVMPPAKANKPLTPQKVDILKRWVEQGAKWNRHWSFVTPTKTVLPKLTADSEQRVRNTVDQFILARLEKEGLRPSPEAPKANWLRRVTLDLTGLPPTPAEVDAFLADSTPAAYEKVVDRLLASPRFGEHMARYWLDAARYGDTHGLHLDNYRELWPYREWVISAFNTNKPYDRFLTEQVAGDLLPGSTLAQQVATGFLRCHVTTSEGGSIEEECYVRNVVDRVDTFGTVVLGLAVGCARCHDHKYDPITQRDYYSLFAFFNSIDGTDLDGNAARHAPVVSLPTPDQAKKLADLRANLDAVNKRITDEVAKAKVVDEETDAGAKAGTRRDVIWIDDALPAGARPAVGGVNLPWAFVAKAEQPPASGEKSVKLKANGLQQLVVEGASPGLRVGEGDKLFAYVFVDPKDPPKEIMLQWHTTAWMHRAYWGENRIDWGKDRTPERRPHGDLPDAGKWVRLEVPAAQVGIAPGAVITGWAFTQFGGTAHWDKAGLSTATPQGELRFDTIAEFLTARGADTSVPKPVRDIIKLDPAKRTADQKKQLRDYFVEYGYTKTRDAVEPLHKTRNELTGAIKGVEDQVAATYVFKEKPTPRRAFILKRGEYDQRGEAVGRDTPRSMPAFPDGSPRDRLGLANWLTSPANPLVSRVFANRLWQHFLGTGLVKTAEDFGAQGEPPSHPELLDWLAVDFRESGWDVKRFVKSVVLSATYRQSSKVTPDRLAKDPANRLLSRGPRHRLEAEVIRDQALYVSGLLVEKVGGPSVKPPQPAGLWEAVGYVTSNTARFAPDTGHEKVHRRSLYTFWKRTAPPPQMATLDAPSREACTVRRERTNTPLQALLLMNETQFVEAARNLAQRATQEGGTTPESRTAYLFKLAVARPPDASEAAVLVSAFKEQRATYANDAAAAKKLLAVGESKVDAKIDMADLAAMTIVANVVLNLDEVLTKN